MHPADATAPQGYCQFCGKPVVADAVLCVHCGRQIKALQAPTPEPPEPQRVRWHLGEMILLVVLTMICPLVGYIYGSIGTKEPGKERQGKPLLIVAAAFTMVYFRAYLAAHSPS